VQENILLYFFIILEMRKGDRLITPAQQQTILDGWQSPITYDG